MDQIRLSYEEMRGVAGDVQGQAVRAREALRTLHQAVQQLLPTWEGAAQAAFEASYTQGMPQLARVPLMLEEISRALQQTATLIQQAEQAAAGDMPATITTDNA